MDYDLVAAGVQAPHNFKPFAHRDNSVTERSKVISNSQSPNTINLNLIKVNSGKSRAIPSNDLTHICNLYNN